MIESQYDNSTLAHLWNEIDDPMMILKDSRISIPIGSEKQRFLPATKAMYSVTYKTH